MNLFSCFKPHPFIGLEIAEGEIRLLRLKKKSGALKIGQYSIIQFPKEAIQDGKIKQPQAILSCLREWMAVSRIKSPQTAIALPSHCIISKRFKLPLHLVKEEYESEIAVHFNQLVSGLGDAFNFDYVQLGEQEEGYQEVLLCAVRRAQLDSYVDLARQAGFDVKIVDVDIYALVRGVVWGTGQSLSVIKETLFSRSWPIHVSEFKKELHIYIQQIEALRDLDQEVASNLLVSLGLALRGVSL